MGSWEPESELDKALVEALGLHFARLEREAQAGNDRRITDRRINWRLTSHAHDRWQERFGHGLPLKGVNHPIHDLSSRRLRAANAKEVDRIRAACVAHAGEASRGTHYFVLPDPAGGIRDRVFVCIDLPLNDRRYNPRADHNFLVLTCFAYIRNAGAALARSDGKQKQIRLKRR